MFGTEEIDVLAGLGEGLHDGVGFASEGSQSFIFSRVLPEAVDVEPVPCRPIRKGRSILWNLRDGTLHVVNVDPGAIPCHLRGETQQGFDHFAI